MNPDSSSGWTRRSLTCTAALALTSFAPLAAAQDLIVPSGSTVVYNTFFSGPIDVNRFVIEPNANFIVIGSQPLKITAASVEIDGSFIASGLTNQGVATINTTSQPELGAIGAAGGGNGGPGVIQLHVPSGLEAEISLPASKTLDDLTAPNAHVLLPKLTN